MCPCLQEMPISKGRTFRFISVAHMFIRWEVRPVSKVLRFVDQGFLHGFVPIQHNQVGPAVLEAEDVSELLVKLAR